MNADASRKRLERNKTKLGHNLKEVLAHLDVNDPSKKTRAGRKVPVKSAAAKKDAAKAAPKVKSTEIVEDEESDEEDEDQARERAIQQDDEMEDAEQEQDDAQDDAADEGAEPEESVLGD